VLLDAEQVAQLLGVTARSVRRWSREGLIARVQLGSRLVRYTPESIENLIGGLTDERRPGEDPDAVLETASAKDAQGVTRA
jgi:predicted site-specific integrase-resolvase